MAASVLAATPPHPALRLFLFLVLTLAAVLGVPQPAAAWGPGGHRLIAELAERQLDPATRTALQPLLAHSGARRLADIASWADDIRRDPSLRALAAETAPMHYINFATRACRFDPRDCPQGRCAVLAIERYGEVLGDTTRPLAARAEALRFLVHFIGDVHQPLHAGYRPDQGGNRFQVTLKGRGTNLHAVWDTPVLASARSSIMAQADRLAHAPLAASGTAAEWAEASCRLTRDAGVYPRERALGQAYLDRMRPIGERQARLAGSRLARELRARLAP